MILGIGIDVVENAPIADAIRSQGNHFIQKVYQPAVENAILIKDD